VPPGEMTLAALSTAARVALTPASQESLARCALSATDAALQRDEYDLAARLAVLAESTARQSKRIVLLTDAQDKVKEVNWANQEYAQAKSALETLNTKPDDPAARSAAGRFKCLVKNDWEHGLPLLLECADARFKSLAERDQAAQTAGAAVQAQIAQEWWDMGEQYLGRARIACRTRAAHWYKLAAPKLTGIQKTLAEKRLDEIDVARLREMNLAPGLSAEIFEGQEFGKSIDRRTDAHLDFDWPRSPRPGLPRDNFSIRWTGYLRAPATGRYTLGLLANEGARVYLDEQLAVEEPKGANKRKPTQNTISLTEGLHPLRVEFWDAGGLSRLRLFWRPPGASADEIVPAKAFVHEIGAEN
jgi:PA14 domain